MEDFNIPSPERMEILRRIERNLGGQPVPVYLWAACMICDIESLKNIAKEAEDDAGSLNDIAGRVYSTIKIWFQKPQAATESKSNTPRRTPTPQGVFKDSLQQSPSSTMSSSTANPLLPSTSTAAEHSHPSNPPLPSTAMGPPTKRPPTSPPSRQPSTKRPRHTTSPHTPVTQPAFQCSQSTRDKAAKRDQGLCVITKSDAVEVCHIYPFCILGYEEDVLGNQHTLWRMLRSFWSAAKIAEWEKELFPRGRDSHGIETTRNMITFRSDIHKLWNTGHFALKPVDISTDMRTLIVEFYWQARKEKEMPIRMHLTELPWSTEGATDFNIKPNNDFEQRDSASSQRKPLRSGDKLTLTTSDPESMPLPSMKILELQWFLTRIVGMAGAGEDDEDEEYHVDCPSDPEGVGLPEFDDTLSNPGLQDSISQSDISSTQPTPARAALPTYPRSPASTFHKHQDAETGTKIKGADEVD